VVGDVYGNSFVLMKKIHDEIQYDDTRLVQVVKRIEGSPMFLAILIFRLMPLLLISIKL
jgi:hypothetical protein